MVRGSSTPALFAPRSQPSSGSSTTPRRSTPTGTPSSTTTSASPTRETLPAATSRGSRYNVPSGPRPLAGLRTPIASSGSPGCGDMTTPSLVREYGTTVCLQRHGQPFTPEPRSDEVKCRWNATNSATAGAASTTAPARIAPYGLLARPATLDR